jgi:hypothetical protein
MTTLVNADISAVTERLTINQAIRLRRGPRAGAL